MSVDTNNNLTGTGTGIDMTKIEFNIGRFMNTPVYAIVYLDNSVEKAVSMES